MTKKLLFFDIDGTIYREGYGVGQNTARALKQCAANGHTLMICTGRGASSIPDEVNELPFDGGVFSCGTYVTAGGQVLCDEAVMGTHCREVMDILYDNQCPFFVNNSDYIYYDPGYTPLGFDHIIQRMKYAYHGRLQPLRELPGRISKLTAYPRDKARIPQIREGLSRWFDCIVHAEYDYIELVLKGCSKGTGVDMVLQKLGTAREDSYGFGDSKNDIPMLDAVGCGVIMSEAPEEIKGRYFRAGSIHADGIPDALRRLGLI